jgi:hypothetical protein
MGVAAWSSGDRSTTGSGGLKTGQDGCGGVDAGPVVEAEAVTPALALDDLDDLLGRGIEKRGAAGGRGGSCCVLLPCAYVDFVVRLLLPLARPRPKWLSPVA